MVDCIFFLLFLEQTHFGPEMRDPDRIPERFAQALDLEPIFGGEKTQNLIVEALIIMFRTETGIFD